MGLGLASSLGEGNIVPEGRNCWETIDRMFTPYFETFRDSADEDLRAMGESGDRWYFKGQDGGILFDRGFAAVRPFHEGVAFVIEVGAIEWSRIDMGGRPIKQ